MDNIPKNIIMNKEELKSLFLSDENYKKEISQCDKWLKDVFMTLSDNDKRSRGSKYIIKIMSLLESSYENLTGVYKDREDEELFSPKRGEYINLNSIEFFQNNLLVSHYRIAIVNREIHKILNPFINFDDERQSPLDEVIDSIIGKEQSYLFIRGYVPQYVYDLELVDEDGLVISPNS